MADPVNPLELSDEEFSNLNGPVEGAAPAAPEAVTPPAEAPAEEPAADAETPAIVEGEDGLTDAERAAQADDDDVVVEGEGEKPAEEAKPAVAADGKDKSGEAAPADAAGSAKLEEGSDKAKPADGKEAPAFSYTAEQAAGIVDKIMAPFKANGKTIQLKTPEEVIQLMQMGANYTRKLQELQPQRKFLMMLANNDLLDEGKLSYLIDLSKKDPAAIQQLIKDAKIDPLDIDLDKDSGYSPGSHVVTDEEANFRTTVEEVNSTPSGRETLTEINTKWDEASKEALWASPAVVTAIHEQREAGVYDLIKTEMDRRITLGTIPANMPFLEAYTLVGDELAAQAQAAKGGVKPTEAAPAPTVVVHRAAAPKSNVANGDRAKAAAAPRTKPNAAPVLVNPLAQSDEQFLKDMAGRL